MKNSSTSHLEAENAELRARLAEAEETLEAIRSGGVDALVVSGAQGEQVFTLQGAETPYRLLMESLNEGVATVTREGIVLYCNNRFAELAGLPAERLIGLCLCQCVDAEHQPAMRELIARALPAGGRAEFTFGCAGSPGLPVLLSVRPSPESADTVAAVVTDLSERKAYEKTLRELNEELEKRVEARTAELRTINAELQRFNDAMVGRELRMIELKREVDALRAQLGQPPRYRMDREEAGPPQ